MTDPADQHRILATLGTESGRNYPLVIALHGQPRRGQAPRDYRFRSVVAEVTRSAVQARTIDPVILVMPVFRFEGRNWPAFDLAAFLQEVSRRLTDAGLGTRGIYVFGHSGAAGCGGAGLNGASAIEPDAVGFFDTCVGAGFIQEVRALGAARIPTFIAHSVETAGAIPRPAQEYMAEFDFGKIYHRAGLRPATCPTSLPAAPLRPLAYHCANNEHDTTLALVLDTGRGEAAHEALVPVALEYFLREYVGVKRPPRRP